jgi:hypothetical protein
MFHRLLVTLFILNTINALNPSAYCIYCQVTLDLLHSAHRVYFCVLYGCQNIQQLFTDTAKKRQNVYNNDTNKCKQVY